MKPVDQTRFGPGRGNCFQACLASLLELPLDAVPDVMRGDDLWIVRLNKWLTPYGWRALCIAKWDDLGEVLGNIYAIAGGLSPRSYGDLVVMHGVVWRGGECLFDPHPSREGIKGAPRDYLVLLPLDPARHFSRDPVTQNQGGQGVTCD